MQYDVQTPKAYLQSLDNDWRREQVEELRSIIKSCGPDLVEGINYKMLSYCDERGIVFGLNAQKNYVRLYVGGAKKIDPDGSLLRGLNVGKGCIRVTKSKVISETQIRNFVEVLDAANSHVIQELFMESGLYGHTTAEIRLALNMYE